MHGFFNPALKVVNIVHLDEFDRKLLRLLQKDGRLTNNELSQTINLSASQCSRLALPA